MHQLDETLWQAWFEKLLSIDSTTGCCREMEDFLAREIGAMGYPVIRPRKGGVIVDLGGEGDTLCVAAHVDDIGLMVRRINPDGALNVCPVGGLHPFYAVMENVRLHTRDGRIYTGSICRTPNSVHVTEEELRQQGPDWRKNVCVVLDEDVRTPEQVRALGVETGDIIALEPRFVRANGYIKSRFVDDKACAALLLCAMEALRRRELKLGRHVLAYFSCYEEIGHGTVWLPEGVADVLALDIAPTGPDQTSDEHKVSIFAKDSRFPYHWEMTNELRETAIAAGVDYVMDVFTPHYGSDADGSVQAGHDVRHAAIGPGTANSHGYERTHLDGLRHTYGLLTAYLAEEREN